MGWRVGALVPAVVLTTRPRRWQAGALNRRCAATGPLHLIRAGAASPLTGRGQAMMHHRLVDRERGITEKGGDLADLLHSGHWVHDCGNAG